MRASFSFLALILTLFFLAPENSIAETQTITVGVKGMTCGFCTRGIRKRFEKLPAVESATPNLDDKNVVLKLKDGQEITDEQIKKIVDDSGYETTAINRPKAPLKNEGPVNGTES